MTRQTLLVLGLCLLATSAVAAQDHPAFDPEVESGMTSSSPAAPAQAPECLASSFAIPFLSALDPRADLLLALAGSERSGPSSVLADNGSSATQGSDQPPLELLSCDYYECHLQCEQQFEECFANGGRPWTCIYYLNICKSWCDTYCWGL